MTVQDYETEHDANPKIEDPWLLTEKALLGAVLVGGAYRDLEAVIKAQHFQRPSHALIWTAMGMVADDGVVVEPMSVMQALIKSGELRPAGGVDYLLELAQATMVPANARTYAMRVRQQHAARDLSDALTSARQRLEDGTDPVVVEGELRARIDGFDPGVTGNAKRLGEIIDDYLDDLETPNDPDMTRDLSYPYRDVNLDMVPMRPGQFGIIAARPGVGKTVACVDIARHVGITLNRPVVFHSLEMGRMEIINRILSAESKIPLERLARKALTDNDWSTIAKWRARVDESPLFIDERTEITVADIRASIRQTEARLAVVDYLGLMKFPAASRNSSRQEDVSAGSRGLKIMSKQEGIPIVAAHQLNRGSTQRADKRPEMSDLRESGALEQDADFVVLLHREDAFDPESVRAGEVDWIVAKQRAGKTGTVPLASLLHQARFGDLG